MSDGGKGSGRRPIHVPKDQFNANWDAIFGKTPRNREEALDMLTQEAHGTIELKQFYKLEGNKLGCYVYKIVRDLDGKEKSRTEPELLSYLVYG